MRDTLAAAGLELSEVEVAQVEAALADVEAASGCAVDQEAVARLLAGGATPVAELASLAGLISVKPKDPTRVLACYTNHRGERRARYLEPLSVRYGGTEWHPVPGILIECLDVETGEVREFSDAFDSPAIALEVVRMALRRQSQEAKG